MRQKVAKNRQNAAQQSTPPASRGRRPGESGAQEVRKPDTENVELSVDARRGAALRGSNIAERAGWRVTTDLTDCHGWSLDDPCSSVVSGSCCLRGNQETEGPEEARPPCPCALFGGILLRRFVPDAHGSPPPSLVLFVSICRPTGIVNRKERIDRKEAWSERLSMCSLRSLRLKIRLPASAF